MSINVDHYDCAGLDSARCNALPTLCVGAACVECNSVHGLPFVYCRFLPALARTVSVRHSFTESKYFSCDFHLFCWLCIANNSQQMRPGGQHGQRASEMRAELLALLAIVLVVLLAMGKWHPATGKVPDCWLYCHLFVSL